MSLEYDAKQLEEINKLQKTKRQLEGILKISRNNEQRNRVAKDLKKIVTRLDELCPDGIPEEQEFSTDDDQHAADEYKVISKFTVQAASPNCEDQDVNALSTFMDIFEKEFWPALGESQLKLDFSHAAERDSFYSHLEESKRNLKILTETIEEYTSSTHADFRDQLLKMKNKQSRVYLYDTVKTLKRIVDFTKKLVDDIETGGNIIMNKDSEINFSNDFHSASLLNHYSIPNAVREIHTFVKESIDYINLPDLD